jgi:phage-related tail fiber protein
MKKLLIAFMLLGAIQSNAQAYFLGGMPDGTYGFLYDIAFPETGAPVISMTDTMKLRLFGDTIVFTEYKTRNNGRPTSLLWVNAAGEVQRSPKDSLFVHWDRVTNKPSFTNGTVTSVGVSSADLSVSGSPVTTTGSITLNLNASGVTPGTYNSLTVNNKGIVTGASNVSSGTVTSVGLTSSDFSVSGSPVTTSGSITANLNTSGVSAGTYSSVTVTNKGIVTAGTARSSSAVSVSLNSSSQISTTRDAMVSYSIDISATLSISGGQTGNVFLEISPDNSNWTEISRFTNGNTGTLTIGLNITQTNTGAVSGYVPAGYYRRLRTSATGSPTITYRSGQEVLQ